METQHAEHSIDSFWEYTDPAGSAARFRSALATSHGDTRFELLTQIARTYSLRGQFAEAHALLDDVDNQLRGEPTRAGIRSLLERGRCYNSAGLLEQARPLFVRAWDAAQLQHQIGLAVDAAHMVAITCSGTTDALEWNERGLALARASADSKAQALIPAMLNNSAWDFHSMQRFEEALVRFEEAEKAWRERNKPAQIQIARWSVARCLRSLGRYSDALTIQYALEAEHAAANTPDGYVFEEIAENLVALGKPEQAKPYYAQAEALKH